MQSISSQFKRTASITLTVLCLFLSLSYAAAPDGYEPDNTFAAAKIIILNDSEAPLQRNFHDAGDADWVKFYAISGEPYTVKVSNAQSRCDAVIELYDTDGTTLLKERDYDLAGQNEVMDWTCPKDGIYFVKIKPYDAGSTGDNTGYELRVFRGHSCITGTASGKVAHAITGSPIADILIRTDWKDSALSDSDGTYRLSACSASTVISAGADGYEPYSAPFSISAGQTLTLNFTLTPAANLSVSPQSKDISPQGGKVIFEVKNSGSGTMNWTAVSLDGWISIDMGTAGVNDGSFSAVCAPNTAGTERIGTIKVEVRAPGAKNSPQTVSIKQSKPKPPEISVTPTSHHYGKLFVEAGSKQSLSDEYARSPRFISPLEQLSYAYIQNQVIVKPKGGKRSARMVSIEQDLNAQTMTEFSSVGAELWQISETVENAVIKYWNHPDLEYMEPNHRQNPIGVIPDDLNFSELWGLYNTGQTGGVPDADIDAPEAWEIQKTSDRVIAVIDTGVDYTHPDLAANMWKNSGEIPDNKIDDDGNGYIDDVYGYDFANNDGDPMDDNRHGTHCAGTIAGVGNNGSGVSGVNWSAKIMALKFLTGDGRGNTADAVRAIEYAVKMGVKITSNSWGGGGFSNTLFEAIQAAERSGMAFIAAAGNNYRNTDAEPHFPSCYPIETVISVGATDHSDAPSHFSNYGAITVDLAAPGTSIFSTLPGGKYASLSGTSMATPHVSGAAALIWAVNPRLTAWEVKETLLASVDKIPALEGKTATSGRLNAHAALMMHKQVFSIANTGDENLSIGQLTITGANASEFSISDDGCSNTSLEPGQSCTVKVSFRHNSAGSKTAVLSAPSNDPGTPVKQIPLTAERVSAPSKTTLTIAKSGEGQVKVNGTVCNTFPSAYTFPNGAAISLEAFPAADFVNWTGAVESVQNPLTLIMDTSKTITANFKAADNLWQADITAKSELADGLSYEQWQSSGGDEQVLVNAYKAVIGVSSQKTTSPAPPAPPLHSVKMDLRKEEGGKWEGPFLKDIRQDGVSICKWIIALNPHGNLPPPDPRSATLSWNPSQFHPSGTYGLRKGYDGKGELAVADMRKTTKYVVTGGDAAEYFTIEYTPVSPEWETKILASGENAGDINAVSMEDWLLQGEDETILVNAYQTTIGVKAQGDAKSAPPLPPKYTVSMELKTVTGDVWKGPYLKDIRQDNADTFKWILLINPHGNYPPPTPRSASITWTPASFCPTGYYSLREGYDGTGVLVVADMRTTTSYIVTGGDGIQYYSIEYSKTSPNPASSYSGDTDDSGTVDIGDVILALQILAGISPEKTVSLKSDVNGDKRIGLEEAVYGLGVIGKVR